MIVIHSRWKTVTVVVAVGRVLVVVEEPMQEMLIPSARVMRATAAAQVMEEPTPAIVLVVTMVMVTVVTMVMVTVVTMVMVTVVTMVMVTVSVMVVVVVAPRELRCPARVAAQGAKKRLALGQAVFFLAIVAAAPVAATMQQALGQKAKGATICRTGIGGCWTWMCPDRCSIKMTRAGLLARGTTSGVQ